jgi:hypothetical protein
MPKKFFLILTLFLWFFIFSSLPGKTFGQEGNCLPGDPGSHYQQLGCGAAGCQSTQMAFVLVCADGSVNWQETDCRPDSSCNTNPCEQSVCLAGFRCIVNICDTPPSYRGCHPDSSCNTGSCPSGQTNPHYTCQGNSCVAVSGCGASTCSNSSNCGGGNPGRNPVCSRGIIPCGYPVCCRDTNHNGVLDPEEQRYCQLPPNCREPCQVCHLFVLINNIVQFLLICLIPPLALLFLVIGGLYLMFGGGSPALLTKAKEIIKSVIIGLFLIYASWLLVSTFLSFIGVMEWTNLQEWFVLPCG